MLQVFCYIPLQPGRSTSSPFRVKPLHCLQFGNCCQLSGAGYSKRFRTNPQKSATKPLKIPKYTILSNRSPTSLKASSRCLCVDLCARLQPRNFNPPLRSANDCVFLWTTENYTRQTDSRGGRARGKLTLLAQYLKHSKTLIKIISSNSLPILDLKLGLYRLLLSYSLVIKYRAREARHIRFVCTT